MKKTAPRPSCQVPESQTFLPVQVSGSIPSSRAKRQDALERARARYIKVGRICFLRLIETSPSIVLAATDLAKLSSAGYP